MSREWEAVIGLEVHVQLATDSKLFDSARARLPEGSSVADEIVNGNTNPVCAGHPGTLPVLNGKAVDFAILAGLAANCEINRRSVFARKHYFYPDLPKGYQISQYDQPICGKGWLEIETKKGEKKRIGITRMHLEEDAGKNVHFSEYSLVNLNRAGVPLIEVVSDPDLRTSEEAGAYLRSLYAIVTCLGICDGNLQEGNFRCDANVSVRPKGEAKFGTRAEIKNVNSFRFVEKAIDHEIARQIALIEGGGKVIQETRLYDNVKNVTQSMRSKEEAQDYRYFPDPDLPPLVVTDARVEKLRASLPELPHQKKIRFMEAFALTTYDAGVLTSSLEMAAFFEKSLKTLTDRGRDSKESAKPVANFLTGELARLLNEEGGSIASSKLTPAQIADLVDGVQAQEISSTGAKQVLAACWKDGGKVSDWIEKLGLKQVSDLSALEPIIDQVIDANAAQAEQYRAGKDKLIGFFVGQVMKASGGKANPAMLQELIQKKLKG